LNIVPGTSCTSGTSGSQLFNPAAFTTVGETIGAVGNEPRGYCHGPHYVNGDLGLYKNWQIKERFRLRFSMDFFNAFNHANFDPSANGGIQSVAYWNNGGGVYCGAGTSVLVGTAPNQVTKTQYEPCSPTNNIISTGTAASQFGKAQGTKNARELQYGLKLTF
jgi:hypothetical protein